jgi:hypothetical protein
LRKYIDMIGLIVIALAVFVITILKMEAL